MKQTSFSDPLFKKQLAFGGTLMKKARYRKFRPLSRKHPIHLVLRSSLAVGAQSFRTSKNFALVQNLLKTCARQNGIKVIEFSNNGNHLHLLFKITNRILYVRFIRAFSGMLAQSIMGNGKVKLKQKFWDYRPFTRIVVGWKGYEIARDYVLLNKLEALGILDYSKGRLKNVYRPLLNTT